LGVDPFGSISPSGAVLNGYLIQALADGTGGTGFLSFVVQGVHPKNFFNKLTINGIVFVPQFFSTGTDISVWEWAIKAGLVAGITYPVTIE